MSEKSKIRQQKREKVEKKKASHIVNGIFIGLIIVMLFALIWLAFAV